jgi:hypothetical protein
MLRDPRDRSIPAGIGQVVISDPFSDKEMLIDSSDKKRAEYERYVTFNESNIKSSLRSSNWDFFELSTGENFIMPVVKFLKRRELLLR